MSKTSRKLTAQAEIPNDFLAESLAEGPIHATTILAEPFLQFRIRHGRFNFLVVPHRWPDINSLARDSG